MSNLANCIKIASDFVHPRSLAACEAVAKAFRTENLVDTEAWQSDVLQIGRTLRHAFNGLQNIQKNSPTIHEEEDIISARKSHAASHVSREDPGYEDDNQVKTCSSKLGSLQISHLAVDRLRVG